MHKHEKQAVERLQSNHIHMLSTLSTAIIAFFLIISLSGTMLFPMMAFADEPQPVVHGDVPVGGQGQREAVHDAAEGTAVVSGSIVEVSTAVREAGQASSDVLRAATVLGEQAGVLRNEIHRFLTEVRAA